MSCGSNTIHVLLLHPLHTDCVCVWKTVEIEKSSVFADAHFRHSNLVELFRISFIWLSLYDN